MTAFNNQVDKEEVDMLDSDDEGKAYENKQRASYTSTDPLKSSSACSSSNRKLAPLHPPVLDVEEKGQFCACYCVDKESGLERKDTAKNDLGSAAAYCHCMLDSEKLSGAKAKQEFLSSLYNELEQERSAAESAANEAISMILRLQVEKSALQMEARHYQQVLEAKALYDEETITQLKDIILSQEVDKLVLEREVNECRQTLLQYSRNETEKGRPHDHSGHKDVFVEPPPALVTSDEENFLVSVGVSNSTEKILRKISASKSGERLRVRSRQGKQGHMAMQPMEACQSESLQPGTLEIKDEAKTKYIVSMSTGSPVPGAGAKNIVFKDLAMTDDTQSIMHNNQLGIVEFESGNADSLTIEGKCLDVVEECWLPILKQLSKLQKQIWNMIAVESSDFEEDRRIAKDQECTLDTGDGITKLQQELPGGYVDFARDFIHAGCLPDALLNEENNASEDLLNFGVELKSRMPNSCWDIDMHSSKLKDTELMVKDEGLCWNLNKKYWQPHEHKKKGDAYTCSHMDSWSDAMIRTDNCVIALEERFATCQSRLHILEASRKAMTQAIKIMKEKMGKPDMVLMIVADLLKVN